MRTEPRYSKDRSKPRRGPKKKDRMLAGKRAANRGHRFQERVSKYLGMKSKRRGIDLVGDGFCLSAKSLDQAYPESVKNLLEDAEIMTMKEFPENWGGLVLGKSGAWEKTENALIIMRLDTFRMLLEE